MSFYLRTMGRRSWESSILAHATSWDALLAARRLLADPGEDLIVELHFLRGIYQVRL